MLNKHCYNLTNGLKRDCFCKKKKVKCFKGRIENIGICLQMPNIVKKNTKFITKLLKNICKQKDLKRKNKKKFSKKIILR